MKIWFLEIGEPLLIEKDARLMRYGLFTKELANKYGHDVTWWTSGFSHFKKEHVCADDGDIVVENVTLRVVSGIGYKKSVSIKRIFHQRDFAEKFNSRFSDYEKPDLLVCSVPTIENAYVAVKKGMEHNIPVVIDIRDEWPDELVDLMPKVFRPIVRFMLNGYYKKMQFVCENSTGITAVSKNFHNYALRFANRGFERSDGIFPLGYPTQRREDVAYKDKLWWIDKGVDENKLICCFFGTIGNYFNLNTVIKAADKLNDIIPVQFVLCGSGSKLEYYRKKSRYNEGVLFPGFVSSSKITALMSMADIGLAPYASGTKMSLPNKVFEYMAGSLPIISSIQGEITKILDKYNCGITYDADSVEDLIESIKRMYYEKDTKIKMGENGNRLFLQKYTMEKIIERFNKHIHGIVANYKKG